MFQLYLQYRLTWKGSALLLPTCQVIALWLSLGTCLSRISDNKHHWSDIIFGALIGISIALLMVCVQLLNIHSYAHIIYLSVLQVLYVGKFFKKPKLQATLRQLNTAVELQQAETNCYRLHENAMVMLNRPPEVVQV